MKNRLGTTPIAVFEVYKSHIPVYHLSAHERTLRLPVPGLVQFRVT